MARSLDPKKIKSAQRALEVLEYFTPARPTATVMDIARSMGYPQSSTSELLNCLVSLGYLQRDRDGRTYRPTARVAVLGAAVQPDLFRKGRLLSILDHLAEEASVTVTLSHKVGMAMQYIHVVEAGEPLAPIQMSAPLVSSAAGKALLATCDPALVKKLVHRANAEAEEGAPRACAVSLAEELKAVSMQGFATEEADGFADLSVLINHTREGHALVLSIHGPTEVMTANQDWLLQMVRGAIARLSNPALSRPLADFDAEPMRRSA